MYKDIATCWQPQSILHREQSGIEHLWYILHVWTMEVEYVWVIHNVWRIRKKKTLIKDPVWVCLVSLTQKHTKKVTISQQSWRLLPINDTGNEQMTRWVVEERGMRRIHPAPLFQIPWKELQTMILQVVVGWKGSCAHTHHVVTNT